MEGEKQMDWFMHDRFGMFIHWGLYSIPARGEWVKSKERLSNEAYEKYFEAFDPKRYNPTDWAKLAKYAGMKYAVMTTKHHDGFCLFDSKHTEYKSTNTKARRDLIREYVEAFRAEGLKVGFYYSLLDWHHPDYPHYGDENHPDRENKEFEGVQHNFENYIEYLHNQVYELMTNYGKIDILWFDFSYADMKGEKWGATKLVNMVRKLQPDIIINNRLNGADSTDISEDKDIIYSGDFYSPEQCIPHYRLLDDYRNDVPWESCITLNQQWGYCAADKNYKSPNTVIKLLVECVSKNGNLLLNIAPNAKGLIPKETNKILKEVGDWMVENSESIYGCGSSDFEKMEWGFYTRNDGCLYAHVLERGTGELRFIGLKGKISEAYLLSDHSELVIKESVNYPDDIFIKLDPNLMDPLDTVIKLILTCN